MEENKKSDQYLFILKVFEEVLERIDGEEDDIWVVIDVLSEVRAMHLFQIVSDDLMMSYEYAMDIVRENIDKGQDEVTDSRAIVLLSAMDNIIDFAIGQQYQMVSSMPPEISEDNFDEVEKIFERYNYLYANVENNVVDQSAIIAFAWLNMRENPMLQYTTQRDERVRAEHSMLDGVTYPKNDFPAELIPPIDYNCRCFLVETGDNAQSNPIDDLAWIELANPIFKESLAKGGRIFTDSHSYFDIKEEHKDNVKKVKERIVESWLEK